MTPPCTRSSVQALQVGALASLFDAEPVTTMGKPITLHMHLPRLQALAREAHCLVKRLQLHFKERIVSSSNAPRLDVHAAELVSYVDHADQNQSICFRPAAIHPYGTITLHLPQASACKIVASAAALSCTLC